MDELNAALKKFTKHGYKKALNDFEEQEKIRKKFVSDYPISKIQTLQLDEYAIGKGSENKSFCYQIENGLKRYGNYHGSTADKFGVYYNRNGNYVIKKKWSEAEDISEGFDNVKKSIISLLSAAGDSNVQSINKNRLADGYKSKILTTYYPEKYICILSGDHIEHFSRVLGITTNNMSIIEKNISIVEFKKKHPITKEWSNFVFCEFLYSWKHPKHIENTFTEEQCEDYLNATDTNAGYTYSKKLVKARKINQKIQSRLKKEYDNHCQICDKKFDDKYGDSVVEAHHIEYFSQSENNDSKNIVLLCPSHHAIIHKLNPKYDKEELAFLYPNGYVDQIKLDKHLR
jgi:hypothetical protein